MPANRNRFCLLLLTLCCLLVGPGCSWFVIGGATAAFVALQGTSDDGAAEAVNSPPGVVVTSPTRLMQSPGTISYTVFDAEAQACTITVQYSVGSGAWQDATDSGGGDGTTNVSSSSAGQGHTFSWNFAADLPSSEETVKIRLRAHDGEDQSPFVESSSFVAGNNVPVIESITLPSGGVTGTGIVTYSISDTQADTSQIEIQFKRETATGDWSTDSASCTASVSGAATGIATAVSPGQENYFPWQTDATGNMPGENGLVKVRIRASDNGGTTWGNWLESTATLDVQNNEKPYLSISPLDASQSGLVYIRYTVADGESHGVSVLAEYQEVGRSVWKRATPGPGDFSTTLSTSPAGTTGYFVWDSKRDGLFGRSVTFRFTPSEGGLVGLSATANFALDNRNDAASDITDLPANRLGACCAVIDGKLYVFGGFDSFTGTPLTTTYAYDPVADAWSTKTAMPGARGHHACAVIRGTVYVCGGCDESVLSTNMPPSLTSYNDMWAYDPATDTWTTTGLPALPSARYGHACAVVRGRMYLFGGSDQGDPMMMNAMDTVSAYDPVANAWTTGLSVMPTGRALTAAATLDTRIYVVGGSAFDVSGASASIECYDPASDTWIENPSSMPLAGMPTGRTLLGAVAAHGRIYALGGYTGTGDTAAIESYDPVGDTWHEHAPLGNPRSGLCAANVGAKLYTAGGSQGSSVTGHVETFESGPCDWGQPMITFDTDQNFSLVAAGRYMYAIGGVMDNTANRAYDPVTETWSAMAPVAVGRYRAGAALAQGRIYLAGGTTDMISSTAIVAAYDPGSDTWDTSIAPMPSAKELVGCASVNGVFYAVGGVTMPLATQSDAVYAYDPLTSTWSARAVLPTARSCVACAGLDGLLYAVGGFDGSSELDDVLCYDPATNTWSTCADYPTVIRFTACVAHQGALYVYGGQTGAAFQTAAYRYDPATDTWTSFPAMPLGVHSHGGAALGGCLYTVGGQTGSGTISDTQVFRPQRDGLAAVEGVPLPYAVQGGTLAVMNDMAYLLGGKTGAAAAVADVESRALRDVISATETDPFTLSPTWSSETDMATARQAAGSVVVNDVLYLAGGLDESDIPLGSLVSYDPTAGTPWTTLSAMSISRGGLRLVAVGNKIYAIGGQVSGGAKSALVEEYDISSPGWTSRASLSTARSHFGCVADAEAGKIYVFGGEGSSGPLSSGEVFDVAGNAWSALGDLPEALEGCLALWESDTVHLFGGERADGSLSDTIYTYHTLGDLWTAEPVALPFAARDMFGTTGTVTWAHRGQNQTQEFCLVGGGHDGTTVLSDFYRFYSR